MTHAHSASAPAGAGENAHKKRWWALGTGGGAHSLHDGFTDTLFVLLPVWAENFGLSHTQVGLLKTLFSGSMAGFQVPFGILAERWGERRLLALGTVLLGAGYAGFAIAGGLGALAFFLILAGLGSSVQHPLASSVIARAFGADRRRAALGTYNFMGDAGKAAFPAAMAFGIAWAGWQASSVGFGILAALAGAGIWLALRRLDLGSRPSGGTPAREGAEAKGWGITHRGGFACLAATSMIDSAARIGFLTFLPFLLTAKGAEVETIGIALALVFAGGAAGKLFCGLIAERVGIIRTAAVTEFLTGAGIVALTFLPLSPAMAMLPLVGAALNGTSSVLYGTVGDFVDEARRSRGFGLFYTLGIGASAAAPPAFGLLSDLTSLTLAVQATGALALCALPLCLALRTALARLAGRPDS